MTYLLDTCIVSKLRKLRLYPDLHLEEWVNRHAESSYFLSVLTLGEIQAGIAKLNVENSERQKQRMMLEDWLFGELIPRFQGRILEVDTAVILKWGQMYGTCQRKGEQLPIVDGLLAATALQHSLIVVTENVKDFLKTGIEVFNPIIPG